MHAGYASEQILRYPTAMNSIFIWKEQNCHFGNTQYEFVYL